jgi:hypothetical protein
MYYRTISPVRAHRGKAAGRSYSGWRLCFSSPKQPVIMSTSNHISLPGDGPFERRLKERTVIERDALIFFEGNDAAHPCCVRNVTNDGASIRLRGLSILLFEFAISFDRFRTMRTCRMIWRDGFSRRKIRKQNIQHTTADSENAKR